MEKDRRTGDVVRRHGSIDELFARPHTREIIEAEANISCTYNPFGQLKIPEETLGLKFGGQYRSDISLIVESSDVDWSSQVAGSLADELQKHKPWWAWCASRAGLRVASLSTGLLLAIVTLLIGDFLELPWRLATAGAFGLATVFALKRSRVMERLFPVFEVANGPSIGSKTIVSFLTLGPVAVIIGLVVNRIS